jgi:hypothetical protein
MDIVARCCICCIRVHRDDRRPSAETAPSISPAALRICGDKRAARRDASLETPEKLAGKNLQSTNFRRRTRCAFVTTYAQRSIGQHAHEERCAHG